MKNARKKSQIIKNEINNLKSRGIYNGKNN